MNENELINKLEKLLGIINEKQEPTVNKKQLSLYDQLGGAMPPPDFYGTIRDYENRFDAAADDNSMPPQPTGTVFETRTLGDTGNVFDDRTIPDRPAPPHNNDGLVYANDYTAHYTNNTVIGFDPAAVPLGGAITVTTNANGTVSYGSSGSISYQTTYKIEDIDKLIILLTLWIDDRSVIEKMEKMYKQWKDLQKKN